LEKKTFHAKWTLHGWNDHIIQSARDAVFDYYKVCTQSSGHASMTYSIELYPIPSAMQSHLMSNGTCTSITYLRFYLGFIISFQ